MRKVRNVQKGESAVKITDVPRKVDNQRDQRRRSLWGKQKKNGEGDDVPDVYFNGELSTPLPSLPRASFSRAKLSERKMIRIFIRERKTNIKQGKYIFHMQIRRRERAEMGQKDLGRYASLSLVKIDRREALSRSKVINFAIVHAFSMYTFSLSCL